MRKRKIKEFKERENNKKRTTKTEKRIKTKKKHKSILYRRGEVLIFLVGD